MAVSIVPQQHAGLRADAQGRLRRQGTEAAVPRGRPNTNRDAVRWNGIPVALGPAVLRIEEGQVVE